MAKGPTKAAVNKIGDYGLTDTFNGYLARKDRTTIGPSYLIAPSKNVVIGTSGRVATVPGYTLDGAGSTAFNYGIRSFFDFDNFKGIRRNLRVGFMTYANDDGKLQFRYIDTSGNVSWLDLKTGLTSQNLSFATFFDTTEKLKVCLWVDGSGNIFEWNGATTTFASATATTITKQGILAAKTTITFDSPSLEIRDSLSQFLIAGFAADDLITVTGSVSNNKTYQIQSVTAGVITLKDGSVLASEGLGTTVTLTKYGVGSWASEGFYNTHDKKVRINGVEYTYTGGDTTGTLTGVTPSPLLVTITPGTPIAQSVVTTTIASMTGIETTFMPTVIGTGKDNQLYVGMSYSNNLYISKINNYKNFSFSATRLAGEGMLLRLKAPPVKFIAQESQASQDAMDMYISSGENNWQIVRSTLSSDNTSEQIQLIDLKIAPLQGAMSEKLVTKMKNHIVFLGKDNVSNFLGQMSNQFVPIMTDFSFQIIEDMRYYDFTDASVFYHRNFIYFAIPKHGIVRAYNMANQDTQQDQYSTEQVSGQSWFWEAPIGYPISGFYVVDGEIYGHSYQSSESYKLFDGGSFNGQYIECNATFAYDDMGERTQSKGSDEIWVEGYIKQNTILNIEIIGDLDYFKKSKTVIINGADSRLVAFGGAGGALGTVSLGTQPLGGAISPGTPETLPAWFHGVKTYQQFPYYLEQISLTSKGIDQKWELICYGTNKKMTTEGNNWITE